MESLRDEFVRGLKFRLDVEKRVRDRLLRSRKRCFNDDVY